MPFIRGETVREKLNRETQFGIDEAVRITREVADALDYAHRNGVIHRDIKPENILLHDGRPMVMDFGIALAVSAAAGGRMTETGLSLGTPHYMSPEQATADKELSARSDIYSLASVLYEMLTGNPPHTGASAQQIIMKIVTEEAAPVASLRKSVPPNVAAAIAQALEKLPADRFDSARAFAGALADPEFANRTARRASAAASPRFGNRATLVMTGVAAVLALLLVQRALTRDAEPTTNRPVVRFALSGEPSLTIASGATRPFAVSPDGRTVVFRATSDSLPAHLWVRSIDDPRSRLLEGTLDGMNPAISPDGETVAFVVQNRFLRTVPIRGGAVRQVATLESISAALSWASNDEILLEAIAPEDGIHRVSTQGGIPERVVPLDTVNGELSQRRPMMFRDAGLIAYGSTTRGRDETEIALYRPSDSRRVQLGISGIGPLALIDERLIYAGALGELKAVQLDLEAMQLIGSPVLLSPRVAYGWTGSAVALAEGGTLVYRTEGVSADATLDLVDTSGANRRTLPGTFGVLGSPRFSPDGRRVVMALGSEGMRGRRAGTVFGDLWTVDIASGEPTRLTNGMPGASPSWFGDGQRVIYSTEVEGRPVLSAVAAGGGVRPSRLLDLGAVARNSAVTPDGRSVIAPISRAGASGSALLQIWLDGSQVDTLVTMRANGIRSDDPRVSPDGKWVAFVDRSSGDVWVRSLTGLELLQVSLKSSEGNPVVWGPDSRRLYYVNTEGLHLIELQTTPRLGVARRRFVGRFPAATDYDLSPDGRTFIVVRPVRSVSDVIVAVHWADEARLAWTASEDR